MSESEASHRSSVRQPPRTRRFVGTRGLLASLSLLCVTTPVLALSAQMTAVPNTGSVAPTAMNALGAAIARDLTADNPPESVSRENWQRVQRLYAARGNTSMWVHADSTSDLLDARARDLIDAMIQAPQHGLDLGRYAWGDVHRALSSAQLHRTKPDTLARLELRLTSAFVAYASDILTGQVDPHSVSSAWHIDPQNINVDSVLSATLKANRLGDALDALHPRNPQYDELKTALARYQRIAASGDWPTVQIDTLLRPGAFSTASQLSALLGRLSMEGYARNVSLQRPADTTRAQLVASGTGTGTGTVVVYDSALAGAVAAYQNTHGLTMDSIVGPNTLASLNRSAAYRARQIAANMERFRWLPRTFEQRYVLVNLPAFQLHAFDEGREVLTMKVVVGAEYDGRSTPVFSDSMAYLVFRPYWNVPDGIAARELWPKQQRDGSYFRTHGYEQVHASWGSYVRQKPSPTNALGQVKFIFPNDYAIYLHDTSAPALFSEDVRAFSHGCIRVEHPDSLALFALGSQGWDLDQVHEAMQRGANDTRIDLRQKLPVYIVYFTAYSVNNALQFAPDIYDRDDPLMGVIAQSEATRDAAMTRATEVQTLTRSMTP